MAVTINDIATIAGVSTMTVSRVVNNSGYVADSTRSKVLLAIKKLGYQPNLLARSLVNSRSTTVYIIVPDIANPFYAELTRGVELVAISESYDIILSSAHRDEVLESNHLNEARGRMADGVILVLPIMSEEKLKHFAEQIPLVVIDRFIRDGFIDSIFINQVEGAKNGVDYLIELGHRTIAFISGESKILNSEFRFEGYKRSHEEHGLSINNKHIFKGDFSFASGCDAFEQYYELPDSNRPTAIFAASDLMALGFIHNAFKHGINVPRDVSIIGFDDISMASIYNPPLTTIRHPYIAMGQAAMQLLLRKLNPERIFNETIQLRNSLIIRDSVATLTKGK